MSRLRRWQVQVEGRLGGISSFEALAESSEELLTRIRKQCHEPDLVLLRSRSNPDTRPECLPRLLREDPTTLLCLPNLIWRYEDAGAMSTSDGLGA